MLHDVLVVLAVYSIARIPVGTTFIACMLTIVGYSINATIVVYDRIRENSHTMVKATTEEIVNTSISQTLSRSINTSLTTLIMVLLIYIMGVTSIKEFALPMMAGIIAGTFSSVFISGTIWAVMKGKNIFLYERTAALRQSFLIRLLTADWAMRCFLIHDTK